MDATAREVDVGIAASSTGVWTRIRTDAPAILGIALQLLLVALILGQADMFTSAFRRVFYLASAGFVVHHFLPAKHRLTFFTALCGAGLLVVLGGAPDRFWDPWLAVSRAVPLVACGAALAGICLLPIGFRKRVLLLAAAGAVIAALRADLFGPDALLVLANSLWEMKRGRQRKLASSTWSVRSAVGLMLRTGGTFVCISLLWSLWSTPELSTWIAMWRHFDASTVLW